jgi:hypothetical protein
MKGYRKASHCIHDLKYHIVWLTKYRKRELTAEIGKRLRDIIRVICTSLNVGIMKGLSPGITGGADCIGGQDHLAALGVYRSLRVQCLLVAVVVALAHQSTVRIGQVDLLGVLGDRRRRIAAPRRRSIPAWPSPLP